MKQTSLYVLLLLMLLNSCGFLTEEDYYINASNYADSGDYLNAIVLLDKAIARKPDFKDALIYRGYCKSMLGQIKESTIDYKKALKLEPNNTLTLFNLAGNYNELENYEEGIKYYSKALQSKYVIACSAAPEGINLKLISPFDDSDETGYEIEECELYYWRGLSYYENKDYKSAIIDFQKSITQNYNTDTSYYYLGEIYVKEENIQKACEYFTLAANLGDVDAPEKLAKYCQNEAIKIK
ncbi:tetratricopeptide repeat protein [uncultured Kordia sp.]|uniref:tetratricopeptide repeat protein n=1 Tax=uncultured Kordia sp. TaxID=507699 RepID=UPI00261D6F7A|nr:tetratricopeptide repeat protein [uncultured Kordia sp.]